MLSTCPYKLNISIDIMAKLKNSTSLSDVTHNKSSLIRKLIETPYPNEELLSFSYYMTTQSDHLYNLSYYIDQLQDYKKDIRIFKKKFALYSRMFDKFKAQCSLQGNVDVSVYIDNLYILTNKELECETEEYIEESQRYKFAVDQDLANKFDLKSNINKNIFLKILCEVKNETAEITINKSLTDLEFKKMKSSRLDDKLSSLIIETINKLSLQITHTQTMQNDEKQ